MDTAPAAGSFRVSEHVPIRHKRPPLPALTPLRFFAAIYVVLFHVQHPGWFASFPVAASFLRSGFNGVSLFFVLSGFILVYNYPSVADRDQFWVSRFARVYPAYLLALLLVVFLSVAMPPHVPIRLLLAPGIASLLLLQAWWPPLAFIINSPAWTLSVEAFFYLCFPYLLLPLQRLRPTGFALLWLSWLLCSAIPVVLCASQTHAVLNNQLIVLLQGPLPLVRLPAFVMGMYAGMVFLRREGPPRGAPLVLTAGFLSSILLLCLAPAPCWLPLRTAALSSSFAALIYGMAGLRSSLLAGSLMQTAGEISYGMYILQIPVLRICLGVQRRIAPHSSEQAVLFVPVLILAAYVVFRWVETPARLALRRWLRPRPIEQALST